MTSRFKRKNCKRAQEKKMLQLRSVLNRKRSLRRNKGSILSSTECSKGDILKSSEPLKYNEAECEARSDFSPNSGSSSSSNSPALPREVTLANFIMPINQLLNFIASMSACVEKCHKLPIFHSQITDGMFCSIRFQCKKCSNFYILKNSEFVKDEYQINLSSVLVGFSVGLEYAGLCDVYNFLNLKFMDKRKYKKVEQKISTLIKDEAIDSMTKAFTNEISLSRKSDSDNLFKIGAIGDAQWSKRSYNRNYNSNACCGSLIGLLTKKIIFLGFRNKYCAICARGLDTQHECFKNWYKSSSEMESSILREGFLQIRSKGAQITTFVADADANTYPTLQISCDWKIEKIDCENHLSRNIFIYADNWRKDCNEKFANKLYVHNICSTVGKILKHKTKDRNYLEYHLPNVPVHLANIHKNCDVLYCDNDKLSETTPVPKSLEKLQDYLSNIARRTERLRIGVTSNIVESYFAVNGKMQQGKIKNLIQRGTFEYRCYAACLLFNNGPSWSYHLAMKHFNWSGIYFDRQIHVKNLKHLADKKRKLSQDYINKRKMTKFKNQFSKQNISAYGLHNIDSIINVENNTEILDSCMKFFKTKVTVTLADIVRIENNTTAQAKSDEWFVERRKRITASNLGLFCKAKTDVTLCNLSRRTAYPQREIKTASVMHGQKYEEIALKRYEKLSSRKCEKSGLVIHSEFHFFAASPDAVTRTINGNIEHIIEIKCPYNARFFTENDFKIDCQLAISKRKVKFLYIRENAFSLSGKS